MNLLIIFKTKRIWAIAVFYGRCKPSYTFRHMHRNLNWMLWSHRELSTTIKREDQFGLKVCLSDSTIWSKGMLVRFNSFCTIEIFSNEVLFKAYNLLFWYKSVNLAPETLKLKCLKFCNSTLFTNLDCAGTGEISKLKSKLETLKKYKNSRGLTIW